MSIERGEIYLEIKKSTSFDEQRGRKVIYRKFEAKIGRSRI